MKLFKSVAGCVALMSLASSAATGAGTGEASASTGTAPHQSFCTSATNGSWLLNGMPSSLSAALPITVASAGAALAYYKSFFQNIQSGLRDFESAAKSAPVVSLARSFSRANISYALEVSYFKTALSTLVKVAKTKDANSIPSIAAALTKADAAGSAATTPINSDLDVWIGLCAPWEAAMNSTKNVALDLANIAGDPGGGQTTLSELQRLIKKQPSSPRVAVVRSTPTTGNVKSATLSVTSSKYRIYTCLSFHKATPPSVVPSICTRQ